jgi:metallo-beta-lactamase family protein
MVIAGSGMCTGGRVKHHLVNNIARPESAVLFVGYQAVGTLGRTIVDSQPGDEVRILGQHFPVNANIVKVHGFSAHADKVEMLTWLRNLKKPPRKVFVVHGEKESAETGWDVMVPKYQDVVKID